MTNSLFEMGRQGFLDGSIDWDAGGFSAALLDLSTSATTDSGIKQITSNSAATPTVVTTSTAHGFSNGDLVYIAGVTTGTTANGVWAITSASGSVFSLTDPRSGANVTAAAGTGGYVVNLGNPAGSTIADNWDDFDVALVGAKQAIPATYTASGGVADAGDVTFPSISGNSVEAIAIFKDTGTASTSRMVALITGKAIVTCAFAPGGTYTVLPVEPLVAPLASGVVLPFSNGNSVTTNAVGNVGDRTITVSSTSTVISAGSRAQYDATGSGLPVTPNGGNIIVAWDNGVNKIFKL